MTKKKFDTLAKEALSDDEFQFMSDLEEQNVFEMLMGLYQGKNRWLSVYIMIVIFVAVGFFIYFIVQFLQAEELRQMMLYGAGGFMCLIMIGMLKFWFWLQINNNAIIRELKRMELQMSIISMNLKK